MKRIVLGILTLMSLATVGCSSKAGSAGLGALGGAAAGGGTYEYMLHREATRLEDDLKAGKIDRKEYDIRKDEIDRVRVIK